MVYSALQLITRSYYLSQVVSRQLQTVSGDEITDGLYLLNALLDYKSTDVRLIPYFTRFEFDSWFDVYRCMDCCFCLIQNFITVSTNRNLGYRTGFTVSVAWRYEPVDLFLRRINHLAAQIQYTELARRY